MSVEREIRLLERKSIYQCCGGRFKKFNIVTQTKIVLAIESSILDASVDTAKVDNIPIYWNTDEFTQLYSSIGYNIKINLDTESSVNKNKEEKIKTYLINEICDSITADLFVKKYKEYNEKYENSPKLLNPISPDFGILDFPPEIFENIIHFVQLFDIKKIGYKTSQELNPYINQSYRDILALRENQIVEVKYSEMYKCGNCGNKKTHTKEIQTRSGDEGGTLFITCIVCQKTWTQY
ncbi:MAG TPA: zinc ribbon domain-containing protein [Verrucomicrobiae bacterium]|nr:zinc ribbon domain-containing protein [Verrucomicrobiae bacterium]